MSALCDALKLVDLGSSLCASFKQVCLDETACGVPEADIKTTYVGGEESNGRFGDFGGSLPDIQRFHGYFEVQAAISDIESL